LAGQSVDGYCHCKECSSLDGEGQAMMKKLAIMAVALASLPATAFAQNARSQAPPYCFDLSRIVDLAVTKEPFASIAGRPRQGDFRDATLVLADWKDCSLYGATTYTCDSAAMDSAEGAAKARSAILRQVKSCLGTGWSEAADRSNPLRRFAQRRTTGLDHGEHGSNRQ
jgi:hypothetical protein